jgi:hypothetical protein
MILRDPCRAQSAALEWPHIPNVMIGVWARWYLSTGTQLQQQQSWRPF